MLLSMLVKELNISDELKFINEQEFETLGIVDSKVNMTIITFIENEKYIPSIPENATMVLTKKHIAEKISEKGVCIVDNPKIFFFKLHNALYNHMEYCGANKSTVIGANCKISKMAYIAEQNVDIGNNVTIEEFVSIKENVVIGDNSVIRAGSIIGGEGFEAKQDGNKTFGIKHMGSVVIENDVEVQQNTCIDKAIYPWDETFVGAFTRFDNLVHIAHGVKIGRCSFFPACAEVSGRVVIGDNVWVAPNSSIINGVELGDGCYVGIGAVITKNIPAGTTVAGSPARDIQELKSENKIIRDIIKKYKEENA